MLLVAGRPDIDRKGTLGHARAMPRSTTSTRELAARMAALEDRVTRLERKRPPPGDGRTTSPAARGARCPGCGLPLRRRKGRCAECGRPLDL